MIDSMSAMSKRKSCISAKESVSQSALSREKSKTNYRAEKGRNIADAEYSENFGENSYVISQSFLSLGAKMP